MRSTPKPLGNGACRGRFYRGFLANPCSVLERKGASQLKDISWKLVLVGVVVLAAIICILPTFKPTLWPYKKINLGLDLQGGMEMRLKVESQKAVKNKIDQLADEIKSELRDKKIRYKKIESTADAKISVIIDGAKDIQDFESYLKDENSDLVESNRLVSDNVLTVQLGFSQENVNDIESKAVEQDLETIRNRIDQFGVSEPIIQRTKGETILVQLPGVKDTERAMELVGKTAMLEFKLVDDTKTASQPNPSSLPPNEEYLDGIGGRRYVVYKKTLLTGEYLTDAEVKINSSTNEVYVSMDFDKKGARIFDEITGAHVGERLAVVLDGKIQTAPNIKERISGGRASITGDYTMEEAHDLAIVLRSGQLWAPLTLEDQQIVGASLGADSIRMGLLSVYIGGILVIAFMALYYKLSGLVADFALVVNILLIAAGMAALQATLTLPGIAGVILTIGMAVDANVLIFERIREELEVGKTPRAALDAGYERATLTILDANVTTLIAALVLFQFGTTTIKGFAVTLSLGVVSSVFTALVLTKVVFDLYFAKRKVKQLSI